mgnify:CR=1 FL=1
MRQAQTRPGARLFNNKNPMFLWPFKQCRIETNLSRQRINELMNQNTDQDNRSIYWGKRFYQRFFGVVQPNAFKIRPVVPYWNLSPVEIRGTVESNQAGQGSHTVSCRLTCPYLRVVGPLVGLALVMFFINYALVGETGVFLSATGYIFLAAYVLVNLPFQVQAARSLRALVRDLEGKMVWER